MPGENDHIVAETAARIFADLADPQTINRMENGAWKEPLWQTLGDAGLPLAWVPEKLALFLREEGRLRLVATYDLPRLSEVQAGIAREPAPGGPLEPFFDGYWVFREDGS
jgi:hypothetical protein